MRNTSLFVKFNAWADQLDFYRIPVMMGILLIQGCIIAPFALLSMALAEYNELQFALITVATFAILISNLAVLPQRIVIPTFTLATIIQLLIILLNIFILAQ